MGQLDGRVAVITGASAGIGEAIARLLAAEGAAVALGARRIERLEALTKEIETAGGRALPVEMDVTQREQVRRLVAEAERAFGPVDILINNAGVMPLSFLRNLHEDEWEQMVDVNVKGVLHGIGAVLAGMLARGRGDIVTISSDAGRKVFPGGAVYCATKWAVEGLMQGLRLEVAGTGLRVTSIQPGATATELKDFITDEEVIQGDNNAPPMRLLEAEDIARAVLYALVQPPHAAISEVLIRPSQQPR